MKKKEARLGLIFLYIKILNICIPISARNYSNVAMVLLHAGADFDLANAQGCTPIHLAAREGLLGLAQSLCAFGCVVDTATSDGNFPLHLAAQNGHTEVVRCLCLAGCKIDVKNKDGVTPELAALSQGHGEISDLLKRLKRVRTNEDIISLFVLLDVVVANICYIFLLISFTERVHISGVVKCFGFAKFMWLFFIAMQ